VGSAETSVIKLSACAIANTLLCLLLCLICFSMPAQRRELVENNKGNPRSVANTTIDRGPRAGVQVWISRLIDPIVKVEPAQWSSLHLAVTHSTAYVAATPNKRESAFALVLTI